MSKYILDRKHMKNFKVGQIVYYCTELHSDIGKIIEVNDDNFIINCHTTVDKDDILILADAKEFGKSLWPEEWEDITPGDSKSDKAIIKGVKKYISIRNKGKGIIDKPTPRNSQLKDYTLITICLAAFAVFTWGAITLSSI